jgi:hypothetical protein
MAKQTTKQKAVYARERRTKRVAAGLCANCPRTRAPQSARFCQTCLDKIYALGKAARDAALASGMCVECKARPIEPRLSKSRCPKCVRKMVRAIGRHDLRVEIGIARKNTRYVRARPDARLVASAALWQRIGDDVVASRAAGEAYRRIGERHGLTWDRIYRLCKRYLCASTSTSPARPASPSTSTRPTS